MDEGRGTGRPETTKSFILFKEIEYLQDINGVGYSAPQLLDK